MSDYIDLKTLDERWDIVKFCNMLRRKRIELVEVYDLAEIKYMIEALECE